MSSEVHIGSKDQTTEYNADECQTELWENLRELDSYAALFCALENAEIRGEKLYGVGLALERISGSLERIHGKLARIR